MSVTGKNFLRQSSTTAARAYPDDASSLTGYGTTSVNKLKGAKFSATIVPYCGAGGSFIVSYKRTKIINVEEDPDHPVGRGSPFPGVMRSIRLPWIQSGNVLIKCRAGKPEGNLSLSGIMTTK